MLSLHAYRITDEDVTGLRESGYGDRDLWEVVMVASFSAALVGIESLFEAMYA
ncbi:MAG: hypothetical protein KC912_22665 [Proteobacteria bacterium]|nr:hypothetical protein [Pseudomonadota bacterium]